MTTKFGDTAADMYSVGCVVYALYNRGVTLRHANSVRLEAGALLLCHFVKLKNKQNLIFKKNPKITTCIVSLYEQLSVG